MGEKIKKMKRLILEISPINWHKTNIKTLKRRRLQNFKLNPSLKEKGKISQRKKRKKKKKRKITLDDVTPRSIKLYHSQVSAGVFGFRCS